MIRLDRAVVVEGKYDRAALASVIEAPILQTDGFGIFRDRELRSLIRRYAHTTGIIILTDSDAAGRLIRGHIQSVAGEDADIVHLYIPKIEGKEKRKTAPGKEHLLGVEGMDPEVLTKLFESCRAACGRKKTPVLRADLYEWGLFGAPGAAGKRRALLKELSLPPELGINRMLDAFNFLVGREAVLAALSRLYPLEKNE